MSREMRAAVYLGPEKIEMSTVPIPEPAAGPGSARMKSFQ